MVHTYIHKYTHCVAVSCSMCNSSFCLPIGAHIHINAGIHSIHNYMSIAIKSAKETSIVTYSCREVSKADVEEGGMGPG